MTYCAAFRRKKISAMKFNNGKPYHGSDQVMGGKLQGKTDTDYFYFLCPRCGPNNVMQILDYTITQDGPVMEYPEVRKQACRDFSIAFKIHCRACRLTDFVKISNTGLQGGSPDRHTD